MILQNITVSHTKHSVNKHATKQEWTQKKQGNELTSAIA